MDSFNLTNNFLIAMPTLEDPYFSKALIYVCEHTRNGALGIIVNRPLELNLASLLEKVNITFERQDLADLPRLADEMRKQAEVLLFMAQATCHDGRMHPNFLGKCDGILGR